ncbi:MULTISPECIES: fimbrial protein [Serratia]|uniref:fimbrial protein n=1 Tax=Serratia TaxID=613 RepID=UPI00093AEDAE|nr:MULTISPECIES: fimbrial protein [Serratia]OKP31388.1 fimbria A protein [Serratia fonticola]
MNFNKTIIATVLAFGVISTANAADQGHGTVTFNGTIIDAPCSITNDDAKQVVELGQISAAQLADGGTSIPKNFSIKLQSCTLAAMKTITATFTGAAGADGRLGVTGTAQGASIALTDGANTVIKLGQASKPQSLQEGNNTLVFSAYLKGDGAAATIKPGDFTSIADFTLAYQ